MVKARHLISVADLTIEETNALILSAAENKLKQQPQVLSGKILALLFEKPSLRTRVSFEVAIFQLGGHPLYLSPDEVGLGKREPVEDVACVLARYVHCIIARTFEHSSLQILADYSGVRVINALSDMEHPCQALADMLTIYDKKGKLKGLTLAYIGDGNNVAHSLLLAATQVGMNCRIASPAHYEIRPEILDKARAIALKTGSKIELTTKPREAVAEADVIYTDVWTSMGQEKESKQRRKDFHNYQIDEKLVSLARKDAILLHPLPAHHGEELAFGMLRHPCSVVFDQAENRLNVQRALLIELFKGGDKSD